MTIILTSLGTVSELASGAGSPRERGQVLQWRCLHHLLLHRLRAGRGTKCSGTVYM